MPKWQANAEPEETAKVVSCGNHVQVGGVNGNERKVGRVGVRQSEKERKQT